MHSLKEEFKIKWHDIIDWQSTSEDINTARQDKIVYLLCMIVKILLLACMKHFGHEFLDEI